MHGRAPDPERTRAEREGNCLRWTKLPVLARQARIEGYVWVRLLVDETSQVTCVRAISGHPILIGSAIDAARQWTFRPITQNGSGRVVLRDFGVPLFDHRRTEADELMFGSAVVLTAGIPAPASPAGPSP